jgi:hypothetical protein
MKIKHSMWLLLLALDLTLPGTAGAGTLEYAVTQNNQFGTVDLQTGGFTKLGTLPGTNQSAILDLARLPSGLLYGLNGSNELLLINPVALTTSPVGNAGFYNGYIETMAFRSDGAVFGISTGSGLYALNPNTGASTFVALLSGAGYEGITAIGYWDIKFDNASNLYFLNTNILYTVDTSNGQLIKDGPINGFNVYALGYENGTLYGFTGNGKIISISTVTGAGAVVATQSQASPIVAVSSGGVSAGQPSLTIGLTNNHAVALSWIAASNSFGLQQSADLTTTNWTTLTNSVSETNSQNQVIVSPALGQTFYRLKSN